MFSQAAITIQMKLHLAILQLDFTWVSYSRKSWRDYHLRYLNLLNVYNELNVPLNIFGGMVVVVVLKSMHIKFCLHNDFPSTRSFIEK